MKDSTLSNHSSEPLRSRLTVRLIVAVPALLSLLILAFGYTAYSIVIHFSEYTASALSDDTPWDLAQKWILVAMIGFFVVAILAGIAVAFSILGPLRSISQALERAAEGSIESPIHLGRGWEVESIGRSFNSMAQYLNRIFQERNRYLFDTTQSGLLILDGHRTIRDMNGVAEMMFGQSNDPRGTTLDDALALPGIPEEVSELLKSFRHSIDDGSIASRASAEMQCGHFRYSGRIEPGPNGQPTGYSFTFRDIARGEAMRQLLARTDQLAALGAFSMGLAHELRNPLGSIKGLAQLLEENGEHGNINQNYTARIVQEVDRMDNFIRELLDFGQQANVSIVSSDLAQLAAEAMASAKSGSNWVDDKGLKIVEDRMPAGPVLLQKERILRALTNIILNAFEATPEDGTVRLATFISGKGDASRAICQIDNDGPAIPDEDRERIFEPFYTTKPKGTGLGLAMASQIVVQNGGTLTAEPRPTGARFVLAFPLMKAD